MIVKVTENYGLERIGKKEERDNGKVIENYGLERIQKKEESDNGKVIENYGLERIGKKEESDNGKVIENYGLEIIRKKEESDNVLCLRKLLKRGSLWVKISTQNVQTVCPFVIGGCFLNFIV